MKNIQSPGLYPSFGGVETISSSNENLVDEELMASLELGSDPESPPAGIHGLFLFHKDHYTPKV